MNRSIQRLLLLTGIIIPVIFWSSTFIGGAIHGSYNHSRDTISQLGANGAKSETFMTISTWLCVLLSICFLAGVSLSCTQLKVNKLPLTGIIGFAVMFGWAAVFHAGNPLHAKGGATLILLLAAPLLSAILWKGKSFVQMRLLSLVSFGLMLLVLLRVIPSQTIQNNYSGLIQRFVHLGWSVWFILLSLTFLNLSSTTKIKR